MGNDGPVWTHAGGPMPERGGAGKDHTKPGVDFHFLPSPPLAAAPANLQGEGTCASNVSIAVS